MILCYNADDSCTNTATKFVIGVDGRKRHFCDDCHSKIVAEIHRRMSEEKEKWGQASVEVLHKNALAGNPLGIN